MRNLDLSRRLLEFTARRVAESLAKTGHFVILHAEVGGAAALLLGFEDLANTFEKCLKKLEPESFWRGVLTNIPYNPLVRPENLTRLPKLAEIEKRYPAFYKCYNKEVLRPGVGEYIVPCINRDYETGFKIAGDDDYISHEVILAQAMNGDLQLAEESAKKLVRGKIIDHVLMVISIEYYRNNDQKNALRVLKTIQQRGLNESIAVDLALGYANRIPWYSYPFGDY